MSDETDRAREIDEAVKEADKKKADAARADAEAGEKLDAFLSRVDALCKRMDKRMDELDDDDREPTAKSYPPSDMNPLNRGEDPDAPRPLGATRAGIRFASTRKKLSSSRKRMARLVRSRLTASSPRSSPTRTGLRRLGASPPRIHGMGKIS